MIETEYLVTYGNSGEFSRFRPTALHSYRRGDRVVVRSHLGLELGTVMCPVTAQHTRWLSHTMGGELLRLATREDEEIARRVQVRGSEIAAEARRLVAELQLPLEVLDVEVLLDGRQAIVHHLRRVDCDYRPLVSALARQYDLLIVMENLALPLPSAVEEGCGKPDCGQGGGGCTSCGSGGCATGGCSSGSCGKGVTQHDVAAYLANLGQQLDPRVPLL